MLLAQRWASAGSWPAGEAVGDVTLDFDARHRRRLQLTTDQGEPLLLDLEKAVAMDDGDGLGLSDGGWVRVRAAAEPLIEASTADVRLLLRAAWHLGNRHLPVQLGDDRVRLRPDHVIADMLRALGLTVREVQAPFQPEGGAYGGHGGHHHATDGDHHH